MECKLFTCNLLGIHTYIMCLTRSTWKVRSNKMAKLKALSRRHCAVLHLSRAQVSDQSKSLRCWHASRFLSPLSCCLSSFCWAVNRLPYIWTHSGVVFYPQVLDLDRDGIWAACAKQVHVHKLCVNPYISIINPLRTDIHTYKLNLTKTPLAPATPAW